MTKKAKAVLDAVRKYFDEQSMGLSPSEYRYVLNEMASTLESYLDCQRDEKQED